MISKTSYSNPFQMQNESMSLSKVLMNAVKISDLKTVKSALERGANPGEKINGTPLIHHVCEWGDLQIVCALLDYGENVDRWHTTHSNSHCIPCISPSILSFGFTPLHAALIYSREDIVKELIKRGADVNIRTGVGAFPSAVSCKTPLEIAVFTGQLECCKQLIEAGAVIDQNLGGSLLAQACYPGNYAIVELLLNSGADPNLGSPICSCVANPKILQLLVEKGAEVNRKNVQSTQGNYPLHEAVNRENNESVQILLEKGANPKLTNEQNQTPLDLARAKLLLLPYQLKNSLEPKEAHSQRLKNIINLLEKPCLDEANSFVLRETQN